MTARLRTVLAIGALAGAALAGYSVADHRGPTSAAAPGLVRATSHSATSGLSIDLARAELRRAVREELADAAARGSAAAPPQSAAPAEATMPSPEAEAARMRAEAVLAEARATRRWTEADAAKMSAQLAQLDGTQRHEVLRQLADEINRGELRIEAQNPIAAIPH